MDKAPDAYRTISEVADDLDLPQHVLRFWETRFSQIRPLKRGGGRRYYRPEDIDLLKGIRHLLYGEGYTIRGVQRIIKESGVKAIQALGRGEGAAVLQKPKGPDIIDPTLDEDDDEAMEAAPPLALGASPAFPPAAYGEPPFAPSRPAAEQDDEGEEPDEPIRLEPALAPRPAARQVSRGEPAVQRAEPVPQAPRVPEPAPVAPPPVPEVMPAVRPADMPSMRAAAPSQASFAPAPPAVARLAADDVRRLQAALYELLECRKRLDAAFDGR